jgi:hypothetical protein
MRLRRLAWLVPVALFFLNPALACGGGPDYDYGAAEMRAAVEGTWLLTLTPEGGTPSEVRLQIEQATAAPDAQAAQAARWGLLRQAHACGTRTLVKSAAACGDSTQMPLAVTVVDGDAVFTGAKTTGIFTVYGLTFVIGEVELTLGERRVLFNIDRAGNPSHVGSPPGTATIERAN